MVSVPSSSGHSLQHPARCSPCHAALVSVPSSSGHSLQQNDLGLLADKAKRFSPLFIGALSSTMPPCGLHVFLACFSPLFIGALSSTPWAARRLVEACSFQSPLHRGTLFNMIA